MGKLTMAAIAARHVEGGSGQVNNADLDCEAAATDDIPPFEPHEEGASDLLWACIVASAL